MATENQTSNSEPTDREPGAANGCHRRPPAPVRSEVKTMAKTKGLYLYDCAEARCAQFIEMMVAYEEIIASLDAKVGL